MKICVSVQTATTVAARDLIEKAAAVGDIVELRIDGMRHPALPDLLQARRGKILVTNRRREEGGAFAGPEVERIRLLEEAVALGVDYVDVEAATEPVLIERLKNGIASAGGRTQLVLSWHDTSGTPTERTLRAKLRAMMAEGADFIKIVTMANTVEDNLKVLALIPLARRQGQEIIAFCMGGRGRFSRVLAPGLGASWTYAALARGAESAPGQLTVAEMKKIWKIMAP